MSDREKYIKGQKNCGIEVGDTVWATRHFVEDEGGSEVMESKKSDHKAGFIDDEATGVVRRVRKDHIWVNCGSKYNGGWAFPYFVLQIVKKKDGSVPSNATLITGELSMSTQEQKVFDVTIIERTEVLHEGSGVVQKINRTVLFDEKVSAVTDESAKQQALQGVENPNFDNLEITCKPFCG